MTTPQSRNIKSIAISSIELKEIIGTYITFNIKYDTKIKELLPLSTFLGALVAENM